MNVEEVHYDECWKLLGYTYTLLLFMVDILIQFYKFMYVWFSDTQNNVHLWHYPRQGNVLQRYTALSGPAGGCNDRGKWCIGNSLTDRTQNHVNKPVPLNLISRTIAGYSKWIWHLDINLIQTKIRNTSERNVVLWFTFSHKLDS